MSAKLLRARSAAKLPSEGTSGASQTMTPSQSHGAMQAPAADPRDGWGPGS